MGTQVAVDAHTLALYYCNESAAGTSLTDSSGNGYDVPVSGSPPLLYSPILTSGGAITNARRCTTAVYFKQSAQVAGLQSKMVAGQSLTFDAFIWPRVESGDSALYRVVGSYVSAGSASANSAMFWLSWDETNHTLRGGWQDSSHNLVEVVGTSNTVPAHAWVHVAMVREYTGGVYNCRLYVNGVQVGSGTSLAAPGSGSSDKLAIGGWTDFSGSGQDPFHGDIAFARISDNVRSAGDLLATYNTLVTNLSAPTVPQSFSGSLSGTTMSLSWAAPASIGGSAISNYRVTTYPGGATTDFGTATSGDITGLTEGTAYTFTVKATNSTGYSGESSPTAPVVPGAVPSAPTIGTATAGNTQATVTWTASANAHGHAIKAYEVTSSPGGLVEITDSAATSAVVSGLTNGTAYTFTVKAINELGKSVASSASNSVTPSTVPGAPTSLSAMMGDEEADLSWVTPASDGGSAITGYRITTYPGGTTTDVGVTTSTTITGLTNTSHTFTVAALNANGAGLASVASVASDVSAPEVEVVSPEEGEPISPSTPIVLDVLDDIGLRRSVLAVEFVALDRTELVHDGVDFASNYSGSTREVVSGGYRFTIRRSGVGWPEGPILHAIAVDQSGNEA